MTPRVSRRAEIEAELKAELTAARAAWEESRKQNRETKAIYDLAFDAPHPDGSLSHQQRRDGLLRGNAARDKFAVALKEYTDFIVNYKVPERFLVSNEPERKAPRSAGSDTRKEQKQG